MKFKQIEKKYPKAHNEFMIYCESQNLSPANWMDVRDLWKEVTDFFDKKGIIIILGLYFPVEKRTDNFINGQIFNYKDGELGNTGYFKRPKAESKAIENAFKIREQRLREETK